MHLSLYALLLLHCMRFGDILPELLCQRTCPTHAEDHGAQQHRVTSDHVMKDLRVPSWLHPLCRSENGDIPLGPIPGVYATHPGQQEDTLNEQTVRSGFSTPVIVGGSVSLICLTALQALLNDFGLVDRRLFCTFELIRQHQQQQATASSIQSGQRCAQATG